VIPLHNLDLAAGSHIPFGSKFILKDMPEWLKKDTGFLNDIARHDRVGTLEAKHALVSEYEAASIAEQAISPGEPGGDSQAGCSSRRSKPCGDPFAA
jgi:hypothetical protein